MIGHVFTTSGAICLAAAPGAERADEYIVLAAHDGGYAVANVLIEKMPSPDYWLRGDYFTGLAKAVEAFAEATSIRTDFDVLYANVEMVENVVVPRVATAEAS